MISFFSSMCRLILGISFYLFIMCTKYIYARVKLHWNICGFCLLLDIAMFKFLHWEALRMQYGNFRRVNLVGNVNVYDILGKVLAHTVRNLMPMPYDNIAMFKLFPW